MAPPKGKAKQKVPPLWMNPSGTVASPAAPAGGGGPGSFKQAKPLGGSGTVSHVYPHPQAPASKKVAPPQNAARTSSPKTDAQVQGELAERAAKLADDKVAALNARRVGKHAATCWDLPERLLQDAGALTSNDLTGRQDFKDGHYVWGEPIELDAVQPGDILQFTNHEFTTRTDYHVELPDGTEYNGWEEKTHKRGPIHSAVVLSQVQNSEVSIAEQHVSGLTSVTRNVIYLTGKSFGPKTSTEKFTNPETHKSYVNAKVTRTIKVKDVSDPAHSIKAYRPKAK